MSMYIGYTKAPRKAVTHAHTHTHADAHTHTHTHTTERFYLPSKKVEVTYRVSLESEGTSSGNPNAEGVHRLAGHPLCMSTHVKTYVSTIAIAYYV